MTLVDDRHDKPHLATRAEMDAGTITAIIGGLMAVVTAFVGGLWQWASGRKKSEADAQLTVVSGFISLITQSQAHIDRLEKRNGELEANNQKQDRRIIVLERLLARNNIDLPKEDE